MKLSCFVCCSVRWTRKSVRSWGWRSRTTSRPSRWGLANQSGTASTGKVWSLFLEGWYISVTVNSCFLQQYPGWWILVQITQKIQKNCNYPDPVFRIPSRNIYFCLKHWLIKQTSYWTVFIILYNFNYPTSSLLDDQLSELLREINICV